jgi:hypothetical protein
MKTDTLHQGLTTNGSDNGGTAESNDRYKVYLAVALWPDRQEKQERELERMARQVIETSESTATWDIYVRRIIVDDETEDSKMSPMRQLLNKVWLHAVDLADDQVRQTVRAIRP